jgi:hypothetical protein
VRYIGGEDAGKFEGRTVVQIADAPAVGLIPVETWKGGAAVHFGNPITEVRGIEIAPRGAASVVRAADPHQRETAMRAAVAQMVDGRPVNVDSVFNPEADPAHALRDEPRLADAEASRQADERLQSAPKTNDLKAAEAELGKAMADLEQRWEMAGRDPAELKALMPGMDEMTKQADELARAARAAALCDTGG